ncbi:hypothetical protein [Cohnella sp. CFH 77786]|uniref:hypothetical protein n=1 Tax=Cohnella sp. CFH 77786 TaxID=2662265 RepID=UPI001C60F229|nr:hypothetical protein [Cohnella sp. CFH 77786]
MFALILLTALCIQQKFYLKIDLTTVYVCYLLIGFSNLFVTSKGLTWDKIVGWSFVAYSAGIPLYSLTDGGLEAFLGTKMYYNEVYDAVTVCESVFYCALFLASFYFAYYLFLPDSPKKPKREAAPAPDPEGIGYDYFYSKHFIHFWLLGSLGLYLLGMYKIDYLSAVSIGYDLDNSGYVFLFTAVYAVDIGILILLRMTRFDKRYLALSGMIHLPLFPLGIRQLTLTFILELWLLHKFTNPQRTVKGRELLLGGMFLLLFGFIGMVRGGGDSSVNVLSLFKAPLEFYFYETTFNYISFLKCLDLFKEHTVSFLYGKTLIDPLFEQIPSLILPNKEDFQFFERFVVQYESIENLKPVGTAHLLTELYVNGGAVSVILFAFLLGFTAKALQGKLQNTLARNGMVGQIIFAAVIPFVMIQLNRGGLSVLLKLSFQFAVLPMWIVILFRLRLKPQFVMLKDKLIRFRPEH